MNSFSYLEPVCCSMSSSNCCFLTCIQIFQVAGQVFWYSHLFQNFPQFVVIYTVNLPWVRKILWRRKWQPTPVFLPGKSHGRRSLVSYCPWGRKESDTTEQLHFTSHKDFDIVNKVEVDVFLELSCFFDDPKDVGNLISGSLPFLNPA